MTTIDASYDTLLRQAGMTIETYFGAAIRMVGERFGDKYVEDHPELIGQLVTAMERDFHSGLFAKTVGELADVIRDQKFVPDD